MKKFVSYEEIRMNGLKLAYKIYKDGFIPDIMYVSLRGGSYLGNIISEFFKFIKVKKPLLYAAVVARSYDVSNKQKGIMIDGWTYDPKYLRAGDNVLFVDDIFDTGRTIIHLRDEVLKRGIDSQDIKIAVYDYKERGHVNYKPDYYVNKYASEDELNTWIHYSNHELIGLAENEYKFNFVDLDDEMHEILKFLSSKI
ncbi:phosphoribosyltransferase [Borrelia coriaceae]|uniref:Phosphoribosyl transferase domain-containing protein n=1 Tax=Borrelia coriaceae ATCC 43381 TaxID=1408429 RepID=W5SU90_9SPIR|nr:phosphoribosyltransferase [Borrelia coriaceae]AHH10258.1 Putative phosphoribosyl transferase domain-containing protein [Borrelia coriaceae ATCC 43381]UPA15980.1 phosphoribosyltransferase [Borrelia coriaceae]